MANGKSVSFQAVMEKLETIEKRLQRVEEKVSSEVELELVARKIAQETAEMKTKGRKYFTEEQVRKKHGF